MRAARRRLPRPGARHGPALRLPRSSAAAPAPALDAVADTLLRNLSLLFVPAAVGVVQQAGLIAANWLAISAAIVISTLLTLIVTVYTFRAVARLVEERRA